MKAICPVSGIPFRTYDSLALSIPYLHPIFSVDYDSIVLMLDRIHEQEQEVIENIKKDSDVDFQDIGFLTPNLSQQMLEAINEKNWKNPVFKLYQTKHLVMLALMRHANLLENENGYIARPKPNVLEAYFWQACELFIWANTIRNPALLERIPKYRISKYNEDMGNFQDYIEILAEAKDDIGSRYRSFSEEKQLAIWERAIALLTKRREAHKKEITASNNHVAARWALTITRAPKDIYEYWYQILASRSTKIIFDGVRVGEKWENVTVQDLRELRDWLEDNLIGPSGEHKQTHLDDSEYYFIARQTVLGIVRRHIAIVEQGTTSYKIVNVATGDEVLTASDDELERRAIEAGLEDAIKPTFDATQGKFAFIKAMAVWRHSVKTQLLAAPQEVSKEQTTKVDKRYEIL